MRSNTDKFKTIAERSKTETVKSGAAAGDKDSRRLSNISSKLGNADLRRELTNNAAERDRLLAFICKRLNIMKSVQQIEQQQIKHEREWYKEVAKGKTDFHAPDPTRWHESAKAFEKAAESICNGQLRKGANELEKALTLESKTYDNTPQMVRDKMKNEQKKAHQSVTGQGNQDGFGVICPQVKMPAEMRVVDDILNVSDSRVKSPPMPRPWWETAKVSEEEQDDEEEEEKP